MNVVCAMRQLLVFVPVPGDSSATLAPYFMQHILLKFGLYLLVVLDDGTSLKECFLASQCSKVSI